VYISPICREAPLGGICIKFCMMGPVVDVINRAKFYLNPIRGFESVGSNFWFPNRKEKSPLTQGLNYRSACDEATSTTSTINCKLMFHILHDSLTCCFWAWPMCPIIICTKSTTQPQTPTAFTINNTFASASSQAERQFKPCVNGDFSFLWESQKFDPSQNQNPWPNWDKIWQGWLRWRGDSSRKILCKSLQGGLPCKWVKYTQKFL